MKMFTTVAGCLGVLLSFAAASCHPATEQPETEQVAPVRVQVAPVRRGEFTDVLTVTGETAALSVLRLASPVAGRVTLLTVRPGDQLPAGEVAARVIPLENEAAVHGFALLEGAGAFSLREQEAARRLGKALSVRDIPLRASFPAVVAERLRNPGEHVAQNDVLLELFDPRSLYVMAQVPIDAAARVTTGLPVQVRSGGSTTAGQIAALVTSLTPQTLTVPVRISLATPLRPPLLHAAVECRITVARHPDALIIPRSALVSSIAADTGTVMVAINGLTRQRTVQLGLRTATEVEVTEGLSTGDLILTQGQYALPVGTRIEATVTDGDPEPSPPTADDAGPPHHS
ncbi:MAG: efflux RND transporter periplasmic adaptor subunit [Candidatus Binatia bacterium]